MSLKQNYGESINFESVNITKEQREHLKELFPEVFSEDNKIDWDKLKLTLGDTIDDSQERYSFSWAGKKDAIRLLQTPSRATLIPDTKKSVNFDKTENLFIEGDNLEVMRLLYKSYFGQIKMIYIDPPYNTGEDFIYPDNYKDPLEYYLKITGQKDSDNNLLTSNPEVSGRFHSAWLSMMYPRLFIARQLLREDGVIFISIDDNEFYNLRMMMNEIFGEENFITTIVWQKKYSPQSDATYFSEMHDYILVYAKKARQNKNDPNGWERKLLARTEEQDKRYKNPDNDPRGLWKSSGLDVKTYSKTYDYPITTPSGRVVNPPKGKCWRYPKKRFLELVEDNRIWFGKDGKNVPSIKRFLSEVQQGIVPTTWWKREDCGDNQEATQEFNALFRDEEVIFDNPKPVRLMKKLLELSVSGSDNEIILDFFAGSASMAHAVIEANREDNGNRRFLMIQLPEPVDRGKFSNIAEIGKSRIRRVIKQVKSTENKEKDLGFKVFKLSETNFKNWKGVKESKPKEYIEQMKMFVDPLKSKWKEKNVIYEIAIKEGYGLNAQINKEVKIKNNKVYKVIDLDKAQYFYICLDKSIKLNNLKPLRLTRDHLFICRDVALNDKTAANLALQCRLKTI